MLIIEGGKFWCMQECMQELVIISPWDWQSWWCDLSWLLGCSAADSGARTWDRRAQRRCWRWRWSLAPAPPGTSTASWRRAAGPCLHTPNIFTRFHQNVLREVCCLLEKGNIGMPKLVPWNTSEGSDFLVLSPFFSGLWSSSLPSTLSPDHDLLHVTHSLHWSLSLLTPRLGLVTRVRVLSDGGQVEGLGVPLAGCIGLSTVCFLHFLAARMDSGPPS